MLIASSIFSPEGRAAAAAEAGRDFETRACAFLRGTFAASVAGLDDAGLHAFAAQALEDGAAAGADSSALALRYLVPVAYWGRGFATDPQYAHVLARANWPQARPAPRQHLNSALTALADGIDRLETAIAPDRADLHRILSALARIGAHPWQHGQFAALPEAVAHVWPARARYLGAALLGHCCAAMAVRLRPAALPPAETAQMVCLSFAFGHDLVADLHYPWIGQALAAPDRDRGRALTDGLRAHYLAAIRAAETQDEARR